VASRDDGDDDLAAWTAKTRRWVLPVMKSVLGLTAICVLSAAWKCERLGDDTRSLLFGVLETMVLIGYEFVLGSFIVDDNSVRKPVIPSTKAQ